MSQGKAREVWIPQLSKKKKNNVQCAAKKKITHFQISRRFKKYQEIEGKSRKISHTFIKTQCLKTQGVQMIKSESLYLEIQKLYK